MIEVSYDVAKLSITAKGHAGYAEEGKDIVCAGVSALLFALPNAFDRTLTGYVMEQDKETGYFYIMADMSGYCSAPRFQALLIFETVWAGLELIARQYPEYLKINLIAMEGI
jgi:uncharacterized protein YsxB (DUF464 family)